MAKVNLDLAKESSVQEIKDLIGSEIATQLNTLKTELISAMSSNSGGAVKSVQRGNTSATSVTISSVDPNKCLVLIDNMYSSPEVLMARGGSSSVYDYGGFTTLARPTALTATKLTLSANTSYSIDTDLQGDFYSWESTTGTVSWQVIEFY